MIADKMKVMIQNSSAIRAMFEERRKWLHSMGLRMFMILVLEILMCQRRLG